MAGQTEAYSDKDGFAIFPNPWAGWRASHAQIKLDQQRGLTLRDFIFKFAPPNENDSNAYLLFVCREFQVLPEEPIKSLSVYALAGVMAAQEGYYTKGGS
jgi:hypothetical protein